MSSVPHPPGPPHCRLLFPTWRGRRRPPHHPPNCRCHETASQVVLNSRSWARGVREKRSAVGAGRSGNWATKPSKSDRVTRCFCGVGQEQQTSLAARLDAPMEQRRQELDGIRESSQQATEPTRDAPGDEVQLRVVIVSLMRPHVNTGRTAGPEVRRGVPGLRPAAPTARDGCLRY